MRPMRHMGVSPRPNPSFTDACVVDEKLVGTLES